MRRFSFTVAAVTLIATAGVGLASTAAAAPTPTGGANAADTVEELHARGYDVQINGSTPVALNRCVTTGVHGIPDLAQAPNPVSMQIPFTTVYVDVSCPDDV